MKIIIYGINYAPEEVGIGKYTTELAEWLSSRGNQIKVITACSYYPNWSVKKNKYFQERINYVDVQRCPLWVPKTIRCKKINSFGKFCFDKFTNSFFIKKI